MNVQDWLNKVAYIGNSDIPGDETTKVYYSKFDNSYITRVGMEKNVTYLAEIEITDELTHGVGYSPKDCKWYGWSHQAIYGFKVGSTCKKGDVHYRPANKQDFLEDAIRFWDGENQVRTTGSYAMQEGVAGVYVEWLYDDSVPNRMLRSAIRGSFTPYPKEFGKGEWVAKTMEDAKQMAIDFKAGCS